MNSLLLGLLSGAGALYVVFIAFLYRMQRHLIYHPDKAIHPPAAYGLEGFSEHMAATPDNETIQLWHHEAAAGFPTIVYFHGNAANMGNRANIYRDLAQKGFGVLAVSYRGYGKSTGTPSETGLYHDARTAITFLMQQKHVPIHRIILFGESLGTGVSIQMATEFDIAALILQAPYTSVAARAAEIYYFVPVNLMIKDKYFSLAKISRVRAPLLMFHGEKDQVIPINHARALFDAAGPLKEALFFPGTGHNDFDSAVISEHVLSFAQKHQLI